MELTRRDADAIVYMARVVTDVRLDISMNQATANRLHRVIFESLLFVLTLVALLSLDGGESFSDLTVALSVVSGVIEDGCWKEL